MPQHDYSEICPIDPQNPFRNPTEEPDYSPDYRDLLPEADLPESSLPLFPARAEKWRIRRIFSLTFLTLLFDILTAATLMVALQLIVMTVLQQHDLRQLGSLPQNYRQIVQQFFDDSSINFAANLIGFLIANTMAFLVGCKLTGLRKRELFRLREFSVPRAFTYIFIGLWIQMVAGFAAEFLMPRLESAGLPVNSPAISLEGTWMRTGVIVLYTCLIAPVTEELLMRGLVLKNLSRVSQRFGILLSALLFGLMHENLVQFLFTFPLGILLGYITVKHNSLTPAIIVHFAVNCCGVGLEFCRIYMDSHAYRITEISYTLGVLGIGTVALIYQLTTERLPDQTPHQLQRSWRIARTSPLLWVLVLVHIAAAWFAAV